MANPSRDLSSAPANEPLPPKGEAPKPKILPALRPEDPETLNPKARGSALAM